MPLTAEQLEDESFKADVFDEILKRTRKATVKNLPADTKKAGRATVKSFGVKTISAVYSKAKRY